MVIINLFNLLDEKDKKVKGWIVVRGRNLGVEIEGLITIIERNGISRTELIKHLISKFSISYVMASRMVYLKRDCDYIKRRWFPLIYIQELLKLSGRDELDFQKKIKYLKINTNISKPVKAVRCLNIELCKIAGAHAADGTLHQSEKHGTYFSIVDNYKSNMNSFSDWIYSVFGIRYSPKKSKHGDMWQICFRTKIIGRYLQKIVGFEPGNKTYTVKEPEIIRKAPLKFRRAFAIGFMTFEAGMGIREQVELCIRSKNLLYDIYDILLKYNVKVIRMERESNKMWRLWSGALKKDEAEKWLEFFEPGTEKWFKLLELIEGFQGRIKNYNEAREVFSKVFPKQPYSKTSIVELMDIFKSCEKTWRYDIQNKIPGMKSKWAHSLGHYTRILSKANVIKVKTGPFGKKKSFGTIIREIYEYNPDISTWRVPYRPWFSKPNNILKS